MLTLVLGCEHDRRVPYIAPTLHNWGQPYKGRTRLTLDVFQVGVLHVKEGLLLHRGRMMHDRDLPVLAYVLHHPREGMVVLNTGLNHRIAEKDNTYFGTLLSLTVNAELNREEDLPSQMRAADLDPDSVHWVILSNLHFAYAGEVETFSHARVIVSRTEHRAALAGGSRYVRREFDEVLSWKFLDLNDAQPLGTMPAAVDLFGDGSFMLLDARGPTDGNLAFLIRLPTRPVLIAGDLAPVSETLRYAAQPASLRDSDAWWDRIWRLKRFIDLEPALEVIPGYDPEPLRAAQIPEIHIHEFTPSTPRSVTPTVRARHLPGLR